jgi:hypothetical protein
MIKNRIPLILLLNAAGFVLFFRGICPRIMVSGCRWTPPFSTSLTRVWKESGLCLAAGYHQ